MAVSRAWVGREMRLDLMGFYWFCNLCHLTCEAVSLCVINRYANVEMCRFQWPLNQHVRRLLEIEYHKRSTFQLASVQ